MKKPEQNKIETLNNTYQFTNNDTTSYEVNENADINYY